MRRTLARTVMAGSFLLVGAVGVRAQAATQDQTSNRTEAIQVEHPMERVVTVELVDVPLRQALEVVAERGHLKLARSSSIIPADRKVTVKVRRGTVGEALRQALAGTGLKTTVISGDVLAVIRVKSDSFVSSAQGGALVGRVTDANSNAGVFGVEVFLDGTRWRTATDTAGRFRFADVDSGTYTLIARRLGYAKQSRKVTVRPEREDTADLALEPMAVPLNELVTTATGQQRRRDLGNAITTIKADSVLRTAPIRTLTDLLANRVPGMSLQHTSGAPGDPARIRLRGLGSINRSNDPIVVVDGVRIDAAQTTARSGNLATNTASVTGTAVPFPAGVAPAPSPLDQIDPNIIEKVEVFKGPSAATLYGPDAANGVIVITTKRGKPGPTRWSVKFEDGRKETPGRWPEGYYRFGHVPVSGAVGVVCPLVDTRCVQDSLVRFQALNDPTLTVFGRGRTTTLSLTASGGTQALTYSVTGSYDGEVGLLKLPDFVADRFRTTFNREPDSWMRRPHHFTKWGVTSNMTARLNATTDVTLATTLSRSEQQRSTLENQLGALAGTYVDQVNVIYYTPVGPATGNSIDYRLVPTPDYLTGFFQRTTASSIAFTTSLNAAWRPKAWFTANGRAGLNVIPRDDQVWVPPGLVTATDSGAVNRGTGRALTSTFSLTANVRKPLWHGFAFETSAGADLTSSNIGDLVTSAAGLVRGTTSLNGALRQVSQENRVTTSVFGWYLEPRLVGQRLALSTGIRLDGGSAYGARITRSGGGLGGLLSLPKLNGSWVISEEPWFPFHSLFSSLRLRGAYGQAQVQPGATDRLRLYGGMNSLTPADELYLTGIGNTHLRPERSTEFEGGFDADLFESRFSVALTVYQKTQIDALQSTRLPGSVNGGGTIMMNIGNIRNRGLELTTRMTPVRSPALTWGTTLTYSRNRNVLLKLGRGVTANPNVGLVEGYPLYSRWAKPIVAYADANGDGVLERGEVRVGDSLVYMGRLQPAYQTALSTDAALFHGAVTLSASFSYNAGATQVDQTARTNWVLARALADPSAPLLEQAAVLAADLTDYGLTQDVSTFRFETFSMSYRAPARVARLLGAQQMSIALQGRNLGLHSTYRGKDPDVTAWSASENIVDTGQLPQSREWQLAVFLDF